MEQQREARIWFGNGKKAEVDVPATLRFANEMLTVTTDTGQQFSWAMSDIEKYTFVNFMGFKIKAGGQIYRLYFLDPEHQRYTLGAIRRIEQMQFLKKTDYAWWNGLFARYKVKMPWFF